MTGTTGHDRHDRYLDANRMQYQRVWAQLLAQRFDHTCACDWA